jgi:TRAP-type C4-dicarboxylate transport system permease small subunit
MKTAHQAKSFWERLIDGPMLAGRGLAEIFVLGLIALIVVEVFGRYVLLRPTKIADEVAGYLLVGITFLGAAYTLRRGMHIKVDILVNRLSDKLRQRLALAMDTLGLFFIALLTWQSAKLVIAHIASNTHASTPLRTPMFIPELLVPVGLAIFCLEIIRQLIVGFRELGKTGRQD